MDSVQIDGWEKTSFSFDAFDQNIDNIILEVLKRMEEQRSLKVQEDNHQVVLSNQSNCKNSKNQEASFKSKQIAEINYDYSPIYGETNENRNQMKFNDIIIGKGKPSKESLRIKDPEPDECLILKYTLLLLLMDFKNPKIELFLSTLLTLVIIFAKNKLLKSIQRINTIDDQLGY